MKVSILIPAFKPTFLRQALASAIAQDGGEIEIRISDDSGGEALLPVIEQFRDPRIVYSRTSGRIGAVPNTRVLWDAARHDLILFLLDDDVLMPHALPMLLGQAERRPDASFYFGTRYNIDGTGRITGEPTMLPKPVMEMDGRQVARSLVPPLSNPIGEFSNVLMNRAVGLLPTIINEYRGYELRMLSDVAFFLSASEMGPAIGVNRPIGGFRRHGNQQSSTDTNPIFPIFFGEWELFIRGERSCGRIDQAEALQATARLRTGYARWAAQMPSLTLLQPGLDDLERRIAAGDRDLLDATFDETWSAFIADVLARRP